MASWCLDSGFLVWEAVAMVDGRSSFGVGSALFFVAMGHRVAVVSLTPFFSMSLTRDGQPLFSRCSRRKVSSKAFSSFFISAKWLVFVSVPFR